ncbi:hypothetical protein BLA29_008588 [Euroglyphus maynei]|uniref:Uncharacterized protein n=1 Tax=Euroglyphus maynei TaxID=6958 RepID=A0A1Y3BV56_EURMA|nr:hypothetical protein BLA29_008588 [Euroglyphus maynei]
MMVSIKLPMMMMIVLMILL